MEFKMMFRKPNVLVNIHAKDMSKQNFIKQLLNDEFLGQKLVSVKKRMKQVMTKVRFFLYMNICPCVKIPGIPI